MKTGGVLEYTETVTDSTALPSSMSGLADSDKALYTNNQNAIYDVKVSIPDTTVPFFKTMQVASQLQARDTLADAGHQVWSTVLYGPNYSEYDGSGNLIRSVVLTLDNSATTDLNGLPLIATSDSTVADSVITAFKDSASSVGFTVNDESDGIHLEMTSTFDDGNTYDDRMIFDHSYLGLIEGEVWQSGTLFSKQEYQYSTVGSYRIATTTITTTPIILNATAQSAMSAQCSECDFTNYFSQTKEHIVTLSNIQIP